MVYECFDISFAFFISAELGWGYRRVPTVDADRLRALTRVTARLVPFQLFLYHLLCSVSKIKCSGLGVLGIGNGFLVQFRFISERAGSDWTLCRQWFLVRFRLSKRAREGSYFNCPSDTDILLQISSVVDPDPCYLSKIWGKVVQEFKPDP
jgi:hypothetical protein